MFRNCNQSGGQNDQIQEKNTYIYDNVCYINGGGTWLLHGRYAGG